MGSTIQDVLKQQFRFPWIHIICDEMKVGLFAHACAHFHWYKGNQTKIDEIWHENLFSAINGISIVRKVTYGIWRMPNTRLTEFKWYRHVDEFHHMCDWGQIMVLTIMVPFPFHINTSKILQQKKIRINTNQETFKKKNK